MLQKENGEICKSPAEAGNEWISFFVTMEGCRRMAHSQLRTDWIKALDSEPHTGFHRTADQLLTLTDLELAYRRGAQGKATGPDDVPGELCHFAPAGCASATFAALWKLTLHGHEALTSLIPMDF